VLLVFEGPKLVTKRKPPSFAGFLPVTGAMFCLLVFPYSCLALNPSRSLEQYRITHWDQESGLPQDSTNSLAQTPDGFLWVAGDEGLARFDGAEFFVPGEFQERPYEQRSANCLSIDSRGQLWIGSFAGLYCRGERGKFRYYDQKAGLPSADITAVATDSTGTVWAGTYEAGLFCQNGERFIEYVPAQELRQQPVSQIYPAKSGDVWVATSEGLYRIDKAKGIAQQLGAGNGLRGTAVTALTTDLLGRFWVGTREGLAYLDNDRFYPIELPSGDGSGVTALFTDSHGMIWIGSGKGGVWRMLPDPKIGEAEFRALSSLIEGGRSLSVLKFCEDNEGDIWIGSDAGLFRISDARFTVFNARSGLRTDFVGSVLASRTGKIWIGTDEGLAFLPGSASTKAIMAPVISPILSEKTTALYEDPRNVLWVGTAEGSLQSFQEDPFSVASEPIRFGSAGVTAICEDPSGDLWVGTSRAGLNLFHNGRLIRQFTEQDGIRDNGVRTLALGSDKTVWIGTRGVMRYKDGKIEDAIPKDNPAHDRYFYALLVDSDGTVWAGTLGDGLARIRNADCRLRDIKHGVYSDVFFTLVKDDKGNLWSSSNQGIFVAKISELNEFFDGKRPTVDYRRFTAADGLATTECIGGAANTSCRTTDGRIWFTTLGGLAVTSPETLIVDSRSLPVVLERLVTNLTGDIPLHPGSPPTVLPPKINSIEIHYAGLSLSAPEKLQYRYKLDGFDAGWTDAGSRRVAYYTNLLPGHYRFRVTARNRDGIWTPENLATTGGLIIEPHYYQTWWFYSLCLLLIGLLIWGLYRWRLAQILQERARLARDLHDTLAQGLVGILWQAEKAINSERKGQGTEAVQILEGMRTLARETLMEARGALRALRAGILAESSSLTNALEKVVRKGASATTLRTEVRARGQPFRLRPDWEQALVRITQEAMANSLKYANARRFEVELQFEPKGLTLQLRDDGVGFAKAAGNNGPVTATSSGLGIDGMNERCRDLGGQFTIVSQPGEGTAITVIAPGSACRRRWFWWKLAPLLSKLFPLT
jgi:ligand-binding sensor domain-containing protein/signal transduction histidine kinase